MKKLFKVGHYYKLNGITAAYMGKYNGEHIFSDYVPERNKIVTYNEKGEALWEK